MKKVGHFRQAFLSKENNNHHRKSTNSLNLPNIVSNRNGVGIGAGIGSVSSEDVRGSMDSLSSEGGIARAVTLGVEEQEEEEEENRVSSSSASDLTHLSPPLPFPVPLAREAREPSPSSVLSRRSLQEALKNGASSLKGTLRKRKEKTVSLMNTVSDHVTAV